MAATPSSPPLQDQDRRASSSPTPSNRSSPKLVRSTSPQKKAQPLPWTHHETLNLIQAYQDKWYSLKKGQLKASQWEEVSVTVAAHCGYDHPSKTATQCRHKIEKLRKRYRTEKQRPYPNAWQYFDLMDRMERGPLPISALPVAAIPYHNSNSNSSNDEEEEDDDDDDNDGDDANYANRRNKSKSINHILRGHRHPSKSSMDRKLGSCSDGVPRGLQDQLFWKRKECFENEEEDGNGEDAEEEEEANEGGGRALVTELAGEVRAFAERFVRMENKKMEMMRETERYRMEMETKRMDMILESQRKIVDTIGRAFGSHKKLKMPQ